MAELRALIGQRPHQRDLLIELLQRLNDHHGVLFQRHWMALVAELRLGLGLAEVTKLAIFYHHLETVPDGTALPVLTLRCCDGLSCTMAGASGVQQALTTAAWPGVRVVAVPCVGRCEQAPMVVVGQRPVPFATVVTIAAVAPLAGVQQAMVAGLHQHPVPADNAQFDPVDSVQQALTVPQADITPAHVGYAACRAAGGYQLAATVVNGERDADGLLDWMESSGLRGLGGAGFPAGKQWRIVRDFDGPRLMAVNIDEGGPGTFKDRTYRARDRHRFLGGLLIAAQVVGTEAVYRYLRDGYAGCRVVLQHGLARLQADPPRPPVIELRCGAGAYIFGEESAKLQSIAGQRGEPRLRPP